MAQVREAAGRPGNGGAGSAAERPPAPPRVTNAPRPPGFVVVAAGALLVGALVVLYLRDQGLYVSTDQAVVAGAVIQLASPGVGRVRTVTVELGDEVVQGQTLATVTLVGASGAVQVPVRSPFDGVVVARQSNPGDFAASGRPILALLGNGNLWIEALIDQGHLARVRPGQTAEVSIPALGRSVPGVVTSVGPTSAAAASQLVRGASPPAGAVIGPTAGLVPVRIDLDASELPLVLGSSVSVRILL